MQNVYALFILIRDAFIFILFYFFSLFVFILFEHPWHAIDVFVRLRECRLKSPIILLPKKVFYFTLVYLEYLRRHFYFFRLFVFVFILFEHPWHAIDVFVRLRECRLRSPIILLPKKYFILPWFIWKYLRRHF